MYFQIRQFLLSSRTFVRYLNWLTGWMSSTPPANAAPFSIATLAWLASWGEETESVFQISSDLCGILVGNNNNI